MFSKSKKSEVKMANPNPKIQTTLGEGCELHGDIRFKGGLFVNAVIKGNVIAIEDSDAILIIGEKGHIEGEVRSPQIKVHGSVIGDVYAYEGVELKDTATITGNVYYQLIEMLVGATVNGSLVHSEKPKQLTQQKSVNPTVSSVENARRTAAKKAVESEPVEPKLRRQFVSKESRFTGESKSAE